MDTPAPKMPTMTMAELLPQLPGICGIHINDGRQTLTGIKRKQPRPTIANSYTAEKTYKPMTLAEMNASIKVLTVPSPKRSVQQSNSMRKKWNSSTKVQKKVIRLTENNQMKHNTVRKVLDFPQSNIPVRNNNEKPQKPSNYCNTTINKATPTFIKPETKSSKTQHLQATNTVRISGIRQLIETPQVHKPVKSKMTIANKENISDTSIINKITATPKSSLYKRVVAFRLPDTPLFNESWKSSCDDSFIQNEKNIEQQNEIENKGTEYTSDKTLEDIAEVSPPVSTPFKEYRNVNECFHNSSNITEDSSMSCQDDANMWMDKTTVRKENCKREESVIVSLCDMLNKATVSNLNAQKSSTDIADLLVVKEQSLKKLRVIEDSIKTLWRLKESELKTLEYVNKVIHDKERDRTSESDKTVIEKAQDDQMQIDTTPVKSLSVFEPCSVIKSCLKSPSYKIPKKMSCLRKKVHYRSLPNVSHTKVTPEKHMGERAMSMYLKMKEHMNFLTTPAKKHSPVNAIMDTPAIASHNLQKQLDKLYNES